MLNKVSKIVALMLLGISVATAQQGRVFSENGGWTQEITGSFAAVKNLHVKLDMGSVRVVGGSQQGISYVIHNHSHTNSEDRARRELDNYKISTYTRGDTAWIVGDWEGGRSHRFSGDFVVMVPREMDEVKVETDGGNVDASAISGRVSAESGGGSIRFDDIGGQATADTGGGSIDVGTTASERQPANRRWHD